MLEAKPTWVKEPEVGTIYKDLVALKATAVLFGEMVQAVLVSSGLTVNVIFVATVAQDGVSPVPIYASPVTKVRKELGIGEPEGHTISIEDCCTIRTTPTSISSICIKEDIRLC